MWPAGLLGLLLGSVATSGKKVFVGIWGIVGVAEWVAYFVDYKTLQGHPPLLPALGHIDDNGVFPDPSGERCFGRRSAPMRAVW